MSAPLEGVRVLDLSRVLAGPLATQSLTDLGAEVLKIERPPAGDATRAWGPPFVEDGRSTYFLAANRGKRSLAVDLGREAGIALVRELATNADVLVENFRPGSAEKLGVDEATLRPVCPRLVIGSVRGFDADGPDAERPGYDAVVQAMSGLMSITGARDGPPMKVGVAIADVLAGLQLAQGLLAALFERQRSGRGQHVEVSLHGSQVAALVNVATAHLGAGVEPARHGTAHPSVAPYQTFAASDGPLVVAVGTDRQFQALCRALGQPGLARDPRFSSNADRVERTEELATVLQSLMENDDRATWGARFEAEGVPWGPVRTVAEVFRNKPDLAIDLGDGLRGVRSPVGFSRSTLQRPTPPPQLNEGGAEVAARWLATSAREVVRRLRGSDGSRG